jgi:sigma-B regulation protein RsbU (phosphoserine phosphatase)
VVEQLSLLPLTPGDAPAHPIADMEELAEIRINAQASRLKLVRECVRTAARQCGFDDETARDIQLAVDEACQNVILHAYGGDSEKPIAVTLGRNGVGFVVRIRDWAHPIDPADVRPRELDRVRPGGLGTHFIREIMDSAEFIGLDEPIGNLLQLTKTVGSES